jgi:predicted GNAT family N-acyltransferase
MNVHITLGSWATQRVIAEAVRYEVFVLEQAVPIELELDEMDAASRHAIAWSGEGQAIGTGRLLPDGHIGRVAVKRDSRGRGIGGAILQELMKEARSRGDMEVILNAQVHAEAFYARFGFVREGELFMDAGIPHILMRHRFG